MADHGDVFEDPGLRTIAQENRDMPLMAAEQKAAALPATGYMLLGNLQRLAGNVSAALRYRQTRPGCARGRTAWRPQQGHLPAVLLALSRGDGAPAAPAS